MKLTKKNDNQLAAVLNFGFTDDPERMRIN